MHRNQQTDSFESLHQPTLYDASIPLRVTAHENRSAVLKLKPCEGLCPAHSLTLDPRINVAPARSATPSTEAWNVPVTSIRKPKTTGITAGHGILLAKRSRVGSINPLLDSFKLFANATANTILAFWAKICLYTSDSEA